MDNSIYIDKIIKYHGREICVLTPEGWNYIAYVDEKDDYPHKIEPYDTYISYDKKDDCWLTNIHGSNLVDECWFMDFKEFEDACKWCICEIDDDKSDAWGGEIAWHINEILRGLKETNKKELIKWLLEMFDYDFLKCLSKESYFNNIQKLFKEE